MVGKIRRRLFSYILTFVMFINVVVPSLIPFHALAEDRSAEVTQTISVDANKEDWESIDPITPKVDNYDEELLGNLYLYNDDDFLYFWIDANNIPDWGENGQYINIAFQINEEDSKNDKNPWNSQFNYSGMENNPQYHLSLRIKNDEEINWFSFYEANENGFNEIFNLESNISAEFQINREVGFEGKVPLEFMDLKNEDQLRAHVALSGNSDQQGAFDVIPKAVENTRENTTEEKSNYDIQSIYTDPYIVSILESEEVEDPVDSQETVESAIVNDDGTVTFNYRGDLGTSSVYVPGSFNQWDETGLPMENQGDNIWSITTSVQPGVHEYKFIVDGEWINDPGNDAVLGNGNNQVIIPGLIFDAANEVVKGESLPLDIQWLTEDGTTSSVEGSYHLLEEVDGVTLTKNTLSVAETVPGDTEITVIAAYAGNEVAHTIRVLDEVQQQRIIELTYVRKDEDYDDWNIWVWGTGVQDDEILFEEVTDKGAVARIAIGPEISQVGFVIRKGQDWNEKDPYGEDRFIQANPNELITKVTVYEGVGEFDTVPAVSGPTFADGNVTLYYRDPELYLSNAMDTIDQVQLRLEKDGVEYGLYDMEYDEKNEYFISTLEDIDEGYYVYTYLVTRNNETIEVSDPYNTVDGKSSFTYSIPEITTQTSIYPKAVSYNENAVVTIEPDMDENVELTRAYIDLTPVGGSAEVPIDLELLEHTIAIEQSTTAGTKTLNIILVDEFGNKHHTDVELEVKTRQIENELDFDWDEARIYFMLTDRFANGDPSNDDPHGIGYDINHPESYHGGDFQGIINHLDYLENLGINTIWITPIVDNIDWDVRHGKVGSQYGYHGYWAQDFTKIDEHLGDLETFKELINQAHDRGIKLMVDVVLNHAGYGMKESDAGEGIPFYPTDEVKMNFAGMLRENPVEGDEVLGELSGLPDFRTEDPEVRDQLIEWQTAWLDRARTERGDTIDYFRVDTVKHVENTTWHAFKNQLTKVKPDFKMIGEHFGGSVNNTGGYLGSGQMDSLLDFDFKNQAGSFIQGNIEKVEAALADRNKKINNTTMLGQFLSSHDEDGFLITQADGDEGKFKVAAALQMTAKGQPVIYYGEEIGMSGKNAGDMDNLEFSENRYDFDWDRVKDNDMLNHYQKLLNIRKEYSNLFLKGTRKHLAGTNETGYSIFTREYGKQSIIVGLNTKAESSESTFNVKYEAGTKVMDLYNEVTYTVTDDQTLTVNLPENTKGGTVILVANDKESPDDSNGSEDTNKPGKPNKPDDSNEDQTSNGDEDLNDGSKESESVTETEDLDKDKDGNLPQTGETSNLSLYIIGFIFVSGGMVIVYQYRKKEKE